MARAQIKTLLSLDQWAQVLNINPYEFNTAVGGLPQIALRGCESVFFPFSWQQDFMSWESIAQAISQAEYMVAERVGYWFAPKEISNEVVYYPQGAQSAFQRGASYTVASKFKPVKLGWSNICNVGTYTESIVETGASVAFSDNNSDGIPDTFTVTTTVAEGTNPDSIIAYVPDANRTSPIDNVQYWQIRPINVSIDGTTATITGHAAQLALPELQEVYDVGNVSIDLSDSNDRLNTLDIYKRSIDTTNAITAYWNSDPVHTSGASEYLTLTASDYSRDWQLGYIRPRVDSSTYFARGAPQTLVVDYIAGSPLVSGKIKDNFARIITYLSIALMNLEKCGCERSDRIIRNWRAFPNEGESDNRPMTPQEINNNPFGARRGAAYAWREVQRLILEGGAYV